MKEEIWFKNPKSLIKSIQLVPHSNMHLNEQINSISRIILIMLTILLLVDFKYTLHFFIISILILIILYFIQRNMQKENYYKPTIEYFQHAPKAPRPIYDTSNLVSNSKQTINGIQYNVSSVRSPAELPFCNDSQPIDAQGNPWTVEKNQNLSRAPANAYFEQGMRQNRNTYINPVIAPPIADLEYWKDNDMIFYSQINTAGLQEDMYLSGYAESSCCGYLPSGSKLVPNKQNSPPEYYSAPKCGAIVSPVLAEDKIGVKSIPEYYTKPVKPNLPGQVNTVCGYNPHQANVYLPTNLPVGNCQQDPSLSQYNKNLFTQTVTPGVYTRNQVNEPINANIGISFQQQFEPTTCTTNEDGSETQYVLHDPRILEPNTSPSQAVLENPKYDNVYDPRFYGYGTSYRSYNDNVTGQPRFMYDDINAVRMPNYVTRSKIDFLPYADTYGSVKENGEMGNEHNPNIRALVQDSWLRDSLQFRNDITESRMRKINSEAWQRRSAPLGPRQAH